MERYAPNAKDLASRDVVSRAMATEIKEGRGAGDAQDHVLLKLDHLGDEVIDKRLPGIREIAKKFANVDPVKDPIPVVPTCHYMMGGIPTNYKGEVVAIDKNNDDHIVNGLYAAGECACVSVHGAKRLGTNSLTDLLVFGKSSGNTFSNALKGESQWRDLPSDAADVSLERLNLIDSNKSGESVSEMGQEIRDIMQKHCGVFRFPDLLEQGVVKIKQTEEKVNNLSISDKSKIFNTARIEALEIQNLIEVAVSSLLSADARKESRGAHDREDFTERNDKDWLKHTMWFKNDNALKYKKVNLKPMTIDSVDPVKRTY